MKQATEAKLLYLSYADVETVGLGMGEIIRALEAAFREKGEGRADAPPKSGIHPAPDAFIHAMPAYLEGSGAAGMKWVSAYPQNRQQGLPYISALIITNDPRTGIPLAVMDARWITAKRTGAATALSAQYLARSDSQTLGVLGCGVQARSHVEALRELFHIGRIHAYDRHHDRALAFGLEMKERFALEVTAVREPKEAVAGQDIVVTAGAILKEPHATIQAGWLSPGAFASLVDFDSYWSPQALLEIDKFCTDDTPQLERFRENGYFQNVPAIHADLGELVVGRKSGRASRAERTIACNLGLALEDVAIASLVYRRALERNLGTWLSA